MIMLFQKTDLVTVIFCGIGTCAQIATMPMPSLLKLVT